MSSKKRDRNSNLHNKVTRKKYRTISTQRKDEHEKKYDRIT